MGIATNDTVYRCPNLECDDTTDWVSVDPEILLVQIEAGDEEVWGVNGSDHIFKRPVNGSGEWSIVPGRMRYISVSRGDYIWGIAPNDSLYVCEKPCTGDWQYIGGSYLEIDGGSNDEAVGLTSSSNTILSLSARAIIDSDQSTTIPGSTTTFTTISTATMPLESTSKSSTIPPLQSTIANFSQVDLLVPSVAAVAGIAMTLMVVAIVAGILTLIWKIRKVRSKRKVQTVATGRSNSNEIEMLSVNCGFENRNYVNNTSEPEYDTIDPESLTRLTADNKGSGDKQSAKEISQTEDFRNREYSIPNEYSYCKTRNELQGVQKTSNTNHVAAVGNEMTGEYECDTDDNVKVDVTSGGRENGDSEEYEYADEEEFWEPASQEHELKTQLEKLLEIPVIREGSLEIKEELGRGQFGVVYRGVLQNPCPEGEGEGELEVAVKSLESVSCEEDTIKFLQEAAIMGQFRKHPNILSILGIALDSNSSYKIVVELMDKGDLHNYLATLRPNPGESVSSELGPTILSYSRQIAMGLMYLAFKKYIHRDIAARNVLISSEGVCKIADFGLSRDLCDENYYVSSGGKVPVKWTAPEAVNYRKYSTASDVWSFGCLLYEIWSLGVKPFSESTNKEAIALVESGYRLPPPSGCPKAIYHIMIKCWHPVAGSRPTPSSVVMGLTHPDFQILKWSSKDISATSEAARKLGAPLSEGKSLFKELQQTYTK